MSIFETVKKIIVDEIGVAEEKVTLEARLKEDLGADSIDAVQVIMDLEEAFDIEIDTDNVEAISTVGNIVEYIENLKK